MVSKRQTQRQTQRTPKEQHPPTSQSQGKQKEEQKGNDWLSLGCRQVGVWGGRRGVLTYEVTSQIFLQFFKEVTRS